MKPVNGTFWYVLKHCPIEGTHVPAFHLPLGIGIGPINTVSATHAVLLKSLLKAASEQTGILHTLEKVDISVLPDFVPHRRGLS